MRENENHTLYERLSRDDFGKDDDQQRESNHFQSKAMLEEFAARWLLQTLSISRTMALVVLCFDRPGFWQ